MYRFGFSAAGARASMINTIGSAGGQKAAYPETASPDDLAGLYTVPAASSNDHLATVTLTTWSSGWQWGWGGWGWGGLWAGVNGWGGLWGGGWGMGWGMGLGGGWGGGWNPWWGGGWWNAWNSGYFGLPTPAELRLPADFWDIAGETEQVLSEDTVPDVRYIAPGSDYELVPLQPEQAPPASGSPVISVSAGGTGYDEQHVQAILEARAPQVAGYWAGRGQITPPGFTSRDNQPDDTAPGVAREIQSKADVRPEPGKSEQSVSVSSIGLFTPMQVAGAILTKVVIVGAAAVAPLGSSTTTLAGSQQTDAERAGTYLNSLLADDDGKFQQMFTELMINYAMAAQGRLEDLDDYAAGFAKGFFVDGLWGNVTGLWEVAKFAVWFGWNYNPHMLQWRYWTGDDFAKEKEFARKTAKVADTVYKVINRMGAKIEEEVVEHYRVIKDGTPEELRALGDKHRQFAAFVLALNVELSKIVRDMSPEERGRIFGAVTWEIAQTAVEIIFTGGAAKAVTGTAKFAHIADKLGDFARYSDKFGDVAKRIAKLFDEGGELRRLLNKLDDVPDTKNPKGTGLVDDVFSATRRRYRIPNRIVAETVQDYIDETYELFRDAGGRVINTRAPGPTRIVDGERLKVLAQTNTKDKIVYLFEGWEKQDYVEEMLHFRQAVRDKYWGKGGIPQQVELRWEEDVDKLFRNLGMVPE